MSRPIGPFLAAPARSRSRVRAVVVVLLVVALASTVAVTVASLVGALPSGAIDGLPYAGGATRWGLPVAQVARDAAGSVTLGALALWAFCVPGLTQRPIAANVRSLRSVVSVAAASWAASSVAVLAFTFSDLAGTPLWLLSPTALQEFVIEFPTGRSLALSAALAAATALLCRLARAVSVVGFAGAAAVLAQWIVSSTGHSAGSADHDGATISLFVHTLAAGVWVGALVVLFAMRRTLRADLEVMVLRYSRVALACFATLAVSGVVTAAVNMGSVERVASPYGAIVLGKVVALSALGAIGAAHHRSIRRSAARGSVASLRRLASVEVAVMAATMGVAVALSRTPGSGGRQASSRAQELLGFELPGPLTASGWWTSWRFDAAWGSAAVLLAAWYLIALVRLRRRGDRWPMGRLGSWLLGGLLLLWATSGAPGVYGEVLFSMHMVQHMTVATAVPTFLVLGAPVTLALRTLPRREDGSRGIREWLLVAVRSRPMALVGHPLVAGAMFVGSLVAFYYSGLFEFSLRSHTAHLWMVGHFLVSGYLFASAIVGIDPGPKRPPHLARTLLLMITFGFHALFSVSLMSSETVLASGWFASLGRQWGDSLERDQYVGASLGWALGDYPLAVLAIALIVSWVKSDRRDGERYERKAVRDDYKELREYNEYLASLDNQHDHQRPTQ